MILRLLLTIESALLLVFAIVLVICFTEPDMKERSKKEKWRSGTKKE